MARYRKNTAAVLFADIFKGIDGTEEGKNGFSSSVYMKNFLITQQGKLKKRCGYKKLLSGICCDSCYADKVKGENCFIYRDGTKLKAVRLSDMRTFEYETGSYARVGYFKFNGAVYIYGYNFYYRFDGCEFEKLTPYVPTVAVACTPGGAGTIHESLNIISDKAAVSYSPDGVSASFVLPDIAYDVVSVTLDGETLDEEDYTYNSQTHTLTLDRIPSGSDPDSLKVTFSLSSGTLLNMPALGCGFCVYGGDRDSRVFSYGDGNVLRYSDVTAAGPDVTYFPAYNFITVGDGSGKITALVRHYDRLIIFTERETWFLSPSSVDYEGYSKPSFPLSPLNSTVGSIGGGAAYADNSPVTLSEDGIYVFGRSTVRDERNAKRISDKVSSYADSAFLKGAIVYDNEHGKEIWMCHSNGALIYNYGIDAFYYYDNVPAEYVFGHNGNTAFYGGGCIYAFDQSCRTDDGKGIAALYESGSLTLDKTAKKRRLRRVDLSFMPDGAAAVKVCVMPNRGEACCTVFTAPASYSGLDFRRVDFGGFTFECGGKTVHGDRRAQLSSFENIRIKIVSGENDGGLTVDSVALTLDGT